MSNNFLSLQTQDLYCTNSMYIGGATGYVLPTLSGTNNKVLVGGGSGESAIWGPTGAPTDSQVLTWNGTDIVWAGGALSHSQVQQVVSEMELLKIQMRNLESKMQILDKNFSDLIKN